MNKVKMKINKLRFENICNANICKNKRENMDYQKYYIYSQIANTYFILKSDKIIFTLLIRWFLGDDKNYNFEKKS